MCTEFAIYVFEMLTLLCIEHTSTMLQVKVMIINIMLKVTIKFWASNQDDVCRIENPKAMKSVQFAVMYYVYVKCSHSCIEHTSTMLPVIS